MFTTVALSPSPEATESTRLIVMLYFSAILCAEYCTQLSVSQYMYNSVITIQFVIQFTVLGSVSK